MKKLIKILLLIALVVTELVALFSIKYKFAMPLSAMTTLEKSIVLLSSFYVVIFLFLSAKYIYRENITISKINKKESQV